MDDVRQQLIQFLEGNGSDDRGRIVGDMVSWADSRLESCHDYIQWVFPNRSRSGFNPHAPILDEPTILHLRESQIAINNIRRMLMRMYSFYSFSIRYFEDGSYQLELAKRVTKPWWITPKNHNYLRLTRIMLTLRSLGLEEDLDALFDMLDILSTRFNALIGEKTIDCWRDAAQPWES